MKKILTFGIMLLFLLMTVSSANEVYLEKQTNHPMSMGDTLYVGGNGTGNYSNIQDAINDSSDGDTVYVYDDSSPYYENLIVDKSIALKGENKDTTVINGSDGEIVVNISSDNVILSDFTILNHGNPSFHTYSINVLSNSNVISGNIINAYDDSGISIIYTENTTISDNKITSNPGISIDYSEYTTISDNKITSNPGISIDYSEYTTISDNIITSNSSEGRRSGFGILIDEGKNNNISRNIINNFHGGIVLFYSKNYSIFGNIITNSYYGISPAGFSINVVISLNNISYNIHGIYAVNCFNYKITKNNFICNLENAGFGYALFEVLYLDFPNKALKDIRSTIKWDGNYWNRPRSYPKLIRGLIPPFATIPWIQIDRNPVQEPYDIG